MDGPQHSNPDRTSATKPVLKIYALLGIAVIAGFVPNMWCAVIALILFTATLPLAGRLRRRAGDDVFVAGHMTYIIRTIWIATGLAAVTTTVAAWYLTRHDDLTALQPCVNRLLTAAAAQDMNSAQMLTPCLNSFLATNHTLFITSAVIAGVPVILYMALRLLQGIRRARRGLPVTNVKGWL